MVKSSTVLTTALFEVIAFAEMQPKMYRGNLIKSKVHKVLRKTSNIPAK